MLYKFRNILLTDYVLVNNRRYYLNLSIVFGIILVAYVNLFDPYEIHLAPLKYPIPINLIQFGYGLNTSLVLYILYWIVFHKIGFGSGNLRWKTYQQLLLVITMVIVIGFTGTIYHRTLIDVGEVPFSYVAFVTAPKTILIATSLATISILLEKLHLKTRHLEADHIQKVNAFLEAQKTDIAKETKICLESPIINQSVKLAPQSLLYLKSFGNYVEIKIKNQTGNILIRAPLHFVAEKLNSYPYIIQCHRQYYVNINHIVNRSKNSGQMMLVLHETDYEIPVSKRYKKIILPILKNKKAQIL